MEEDFTVEVRSTARGIRKGPERERENNRLNRASRLNWTERKWGGGERGGPRETRAMWQGDRKQKLGAVGTKPLN